MASLEQREKFLHLLSKLLNFSPTQSPDLPPSERKQIRGNLTHMAMKLCEFHGVSQGVAMPGIDWYIVPHPLKHFAPSLANFSPTKNIRSWFVSHQNPSTKTCWGGGGGGGVDSHQIRQFYQAGAKIWRSISFSDLLKISPATSEMSEWKSGFSVACSPAHAFPFLFLESVGWRTGQL